MLIWNVATIYKCMLYNKCNKQVIHLLRSLKIYSTLLKITRNYKFTMALALGDE